MGKPNIVKTKTIQKKIEHEQFNRKDLKRPDQIQQWLFDAVNYMYIRRKVFIASTIGILVLIFGLFGGFKYHEYLEEKQAEQFYSAIAILNDKNISDIEKQKKAVVEFQKFIDKNSSDMLAAFAWMYVAELNVKQNKWAEAENAFSKVTNHSKATENIKSNARMGMVRMDMNQKNWDSAVKNLEILGNKKGKDVNLYLKAQISLGKGEIEKARGFLQEMIKNNPDSQLKKDAEDTLLSLN